MNSRRFPILIGISLVAIAIAAFLVLRRAPEAEGSLLAGPVIPGLSERLNDVATVRFIKAGDVPYLTLNRGEDGWTVAERADYPADEAKVRLALINLGESRVLEPKTADPERYAQLGVEDVSDANATGTRVELVGDGVDSALIVGKPAAQGGEGTYVRRVGEDASLLATGNLVPDPEIGPWLRREITDIASDRIREIELVKGDTQPLRVFKEAEGDANFQVADVPRGRELQSDVVANGLGSMLAGLTLDDVTQDTGDAAIPDGLEPHRATYRLFDGRIISMTGWQEPESEDGNAGKAYARFAVSLDEAQARSAIAAAIAAEQAQAAIDAASADSVDAGDPASAAATQGDGAGSATATAAADDRAESSAQQPADSADADGDGAGTDTPAQPTIDVEARTAERLAELQRDVEMLNARLQGWVFEIPAYKFANVDKTLDDLLKPQGE